MTFSKRQTVMCANFSDEPAAKRSKKVRGQQRAGRSDRPPIGRPRVPVFELLEQREMLSGNTYTAAPSASAIDSSAAYNSSSSDNNLRSAIAAANADTGTATDTINLSSGTYTLSLGQLEITSTAHTLIIDGQGSTGPDATIIDQTALDRVFQIDSGVTVIFENLEITGGTAETDASGGTGAAEGGGILNQGSLTLDNVAVMNNTAKATLAGEGAFGGGIFSTGALTINGLTPGASLIEGNSAIGFAGTDWHQFRRRRLCRRWRHLLEHALPNSRSPAPRSPTIPRPEEPARRTPAAKMIMPASASAADFTSPTTTAAPTTVLNDDTIAGNEAIGGNGGTGATGEDGGTGGYGYGGGIATEYASTTNQYVTGVPIEISNSTISGNTALGGTGGAAGAGGAAPAAPTGPSAAGSKTVLPEPNCSTTPSSATPPTEAAAIRPAAESTTIPAAC